MQLYAYQQMMINLHKCIEPLFYKDTVITIMATNQLDI